MTTLTDRIARHQVYLESVKVGAIAAFAPYVKLLDDDIRREFAVVRVGDMGELTKGNLAKFINILRGVLKKHFSRYLAKMITYLLRLMRIDREIFIGILEGADAPGNDSLWSTVKNTPLPSNGQFIEDMLGGFQASAESRVIDTIHKAYSNSSTVAQTLAAIVGDNSMLFGQALLGKFSQQNSAMIDTIIQHISQVVESAIAKSLFDKYTWWSIIDKGTTEICVARDGNTYEYGKGPLPPAHYRCRSTTVPGNLEDKPASFYAWLKTQPDDLIIDMLGGLVGKSFVAGHTKSANFNAFANPIPLSLEDFLGKLPLILT